MILENKTEEKIWELVKNFAYRGTDRICDDLEPKEKEIVRGLKVYIEDNGKMIKNDIYSQGQIIEWLDSQITKQSEFDSL